jgi:hypothetical protein
MERARPTCPIIIAHSLCIGEFIQYHLTAGYDRPLYGGYFDIATGRSWPPVARGGLMGQRPGAIDPLRSFTTVR